MVLIGLRGVSFSGMRAAVSASVVSTFRLTLCSSVGFSAFRLASTTSVAATTAAGVTSTLGRVTRPAKVKPDSPKRTQLARAGSKASQTSTPKSSQLKRGISRVSQKIQEPAPTSPPSGSAAPPPAEQRSSPPSDTQETQHSASLPGAPAVSQRYLQARLPDLASEYSPSNPVPLASVLCESPQVVQWQCRICKHEWKRSVFERTVLGSSCPNCTALLEPKLSTMNAKLSLDLHPTRNDPFVTADTLTLTHRSPLWWRCGDCQHEFQATLRQRVAGTAADRACPNCSGKNNSKEFGALVQEWHPTKNGDLKPDNAIRNDAVGRKRMCWWLCPSCAFEWQSPAAVRLRGYGACPQCHPSRSQITGIPKGAKKPNEATAGENPLEWVETK